MMMRTAVLVAAPLACFMFFAPDPASARGCGPDRIKRLSTGACMNKTAAIRAGIYRPHRKLASARKPVRVVMSSHAMGRPPRDDSERSMRPVPPKAQASNEIWSIPVDQGKLNWHFWVHDQRQRAETGSL